MSYRRSLEVIPKPHNEDIERSRDLFRGVYRYHSGGPSVPKVENPVNLPRDQKQIDSLINHSHEFSIWILMFSFFKADIKKPIEQVE